MLDGFLASGAAARRPAAGEDRRGREALAREVATLGGEAYYRGDAGAARLLLAVADLLRSLPAAAATSGSAVPLDALRGAGAAVP